MIYFFLSLVFLIFFSFEYTYSCANQNQKENIFIMWFDNALSFLSTYVQKKKKIKIKKKEEEGEKEEPIKEKR